ncbi:MAG: endonuclease V [Myxococcota bacterium]
MIAVTDVAYVGDVACAAAVLAERWDAQFPAATRAVLRTPIADYVPGAFWERELPCLLSVLDGLRPDVVVVDGYVWLDDHGRKGLGAHVHDALAIPVVGVAKTSFAGASHAAQVVRGTSAKPLYVTAVGMDRDAAAEAVRGMHGPNRLPTLLVLADHLARSGRAT